MLQTLVAFLFISSASCLLRGRQRERATNHTRQECKWKTQQWITEFDRRRLKGPVFFFHVNHHNGRNIAEYARVLGGYHMRLFGRWGDVDSFKSGVRTQLPEGYDMFQDKSWTDLEDSFDGHTLDDLNCGGTRTPRIFVTSARHPVANLLTREAYNQANIHEFGLMQSCESDNIALRVFAGKICHGEFAKSCPKLTRADLEIAKARVRKMDAIFILEHWPSTIKLACSRLGWSNCETNGLDIQFNETYASDILDQLDEESWKQLFKRNELGIEFYEYMKQLSFDMLKEDGLHVPTEYEQKHALPVLKSLQGAKALAVPFHKWRNLSANRVSRSLTRWQC
ncbi:unnamed protein product [Prorocentrum cordatum]|uniref:Uncharacterized protein n=1 Tax=Prorocentrum cordatum TaxID=2364126 RepID=A0ABN9YGS5_9DINO|nr:unnamed protein product [Polarella glacialis]